MHQCRERGSEKQERGEHNMREFIKVRCHMSVWTGIWTLLVTGFVFSMSSGASAQDITVTEQTFGCILDWPKVRNTYFKHDDPKRLKEAMRIFRDRVPDKEYPVGTILQLIPFEAMVKHPRERFPTTNGWEFFDLDVSKDGTKIKERGEQVVNHSQGVTCLSCHQPAAKFDFVCEKGHGCAPIPFDDQKIAAIQNGDLRCTEK
jgi:hypothetical protein